MSYLHRQFEENKFWSKISVKDIMCVVSIILSILTIIAILIYLGTSNNFLVESTENNDLSKTLTVEELLSKTSTTNTLISTTETTTSTTSNMATASTTSTEQSTLVTETTTVTESSSTTTSNQEQTTTKQVETKVTTTSQTVTAVAATTAIPETESIVTQTSTEHYVEEWTGPILTRSAGTIQGPSGKETYYNLNMSGVVSAMRAKGYDYEYWVRDDGVKMFGSYVMCAANLQLRPKGTLVQTSLGMAIVCDTGGFAHSNATQIDIAVNW